MADWSQLTPDLIGEIAKQLCRLEDFAVFSSVCRSWRTAAVKENWVPGCQLPWLVLAEQKDDDRHGFFNFNSNKTYFFNIPELRGTRFWGSSHGWIFTYNLELEMNLINPLSQLKLSLPHTNTLAEMPYDAPPEFFRHNFIRKPLVIKRKHGLLVVVIYGDHETLAIARPGDKSWTKVEYEAVHGIRHIAYSHSSDQLFALCGRGIVYIFDFNGQPEILKLVTTTPEPSHIDIANRIYVVESIGGDILMVLKQVREFPKNKCYYWTKSFNVFKFVFEDNKWIELKTLGEMALFLGDCESMCLSSNEIFGIRGNSIYFTDDNDDLWIGPKKNMGGHDIGVYDFKKRKVQRLPNCPGKDYLHSKLSCPVWMMPNFF